MEIAVACGPKLLMILIFSVYEIAAQEGPGIVIAHPGQDVELLCTVTGAVPAWRVNGEAYTLSALFMGQLAGHNNSGSNIIVEDIMMNDSRNGSVYICVIPQISPTPDIEGDPTILYVAGIPGMVLDVTVDNNTININGNNITLTLSWGEPFDSFDPIVNYTVSCSGDVTCPPNFTTTDNTTNYTITNYLTTMTNYTFSVVATNSIGSGEAGVVMITTPAIDQAEITLLSCQPKDLDNQCVVRWELSSPEDVTVYRICYYLNSTEMAVICENVTRPAMEHTFVAPALFMFSDVVVVTVTIFNLLGKGPASGPSTATIYASSVTDAVIFVSIDLNVTTISSNLTHSTIIVHIIRVNVSVNLLADSTNDSMIVIVERSTVTANDLVNVVTVALDDTYTTIIMLRDVTSSTYNITVISIIHPESEADMVNVTANDETGIAQINNTGPTRTATVTIDKLACGTEYTIKAGGIFNQMLAGPRLNLGNTSKLLCEIIRNQLVEDLGLNDDRRHHCPCLIFWIILAVIVVIVLIVHTPVGVLLRHYYQECPDESRSCIVLLVILGVLTLGISLLIWYIYLKCQKKTKCSRLQFIAMIVSHILAVGIPALLWYLIHPCCIKKKEGKPDTGDTPLTSPNQVKPEIDTGMFTKAVKKTEYTQQQQQEYAVVDKSKKAEEPSRKQNTELNYLGPDDLEIQKGPEIRFKTDHTVQYGQFDDTT